ncbi:MAG TPA: DUF4292 domain-containing protein [Calditrichaeota bacterium]|nr:DUF4292 domain-containing protein [Calditrichota bacterium]
MRYFLFFLTFVLISCSTSKRTVKKNLELSYRELLQHNVSWQKAIHSLQGRARIVLDSPQYSGNFDAEILINGPDSLLLSVEGPFGMDVGKVFIGRNRFIFYNQVNNQFYTGDKSIFEDRNFLHFPLKIKELRDIFGARDRFDVLRRDLSEIRDDQYYIEASNGEMRYKMWFSPYYLHINRIEYYDNDRLLFYKEYSQFKEVNGVYFPMAIDFVRPQEQQAVSIYYRDLKLNQPIDNGLFEIKISDSARQIDLSLENTL